jgi:uncharacterized SAM-binding protein YcdF (DUF218 family)
MFFVLSKLLAFLLNPFNWILGCLVIALWTKNVKRKQRFLGLSLFLFLFFTNGFLCNQVFKVWENEIVEPTFVADSSYQVAVLLGGYLDNKGMPDDGRFIFGDGANRFTQTFDLYQQGHIERILLTGGRSDILKRNAAEAPRAKQLLQQWGVPDSVIIVEGEARNTYENALFTKQYLDSLGYDHCLLVTSAFHMPRATACFNKAEVEYDTYFVDYQYIKVPPKFKHFVLPDTGAPGMWQLLLKEWVGLVAYKIAGYV